MADETRSGEPVRVEVVLTLADCERVIDLRDRGMMGPYCATATLVGRDALVYRLGLAAETWGESRSWVDGTFTEFHAALAELRAFDAKEGENDGNSRET